MQDYESLPFVVCDECGHGYTEAEAEAIAIVSDETRSYGGHEYECTECGSVISE